MAFRESEPIRYSIQIGSKGIYLNKHPNYLDILEMVLLMAMTRDIYIEID